VYAAEIAAFEGTSYDSITNFVDLTALARDSMRTRW